VQVPPLRLRRQRWLGKFGSPALCVEAKGRLKQIRL